MFCKPALDARKLSLCFAVLGRCVLAGRARAARVARIDGKHLTTAPSLFVFQLAAKRAPALIENRLVQAGLGFDTSPGRCNGASDTTHGALLFTVWFNPKFVGLQVFHAMNYICAINADDKITCVKIVFVRYKITLALQQKLVFVTKYCDGAATKDVIDDMRG